MRFTLALAGECFNVRTLHEDTYKLCAGYVADVSETAGVVITTTQEDIERERLYHAQEALWEHRQPEPFTDGVLESTAVYRHIADYFAEHEGAVVHGVLLSLEGQGYLFTAKSGTGKSTHARNWLRCYPEARIINGDKPVLRLEQGQLYGYGTPWAGKEGWQENARVPLRAVVVLERAKENHIERVKFGDVFSQLLSAVYKPKAALGTKRAVDFLLKLQGHVSCYRLGCNMDVDSARVAYEGIE